MKNRLGCLWITLAILVLPTLLYANGNGNVFAGVNNCTGSGVLVGGLNYLDIFIMNDAPLYSISIGLEFTATSGTFSFACPFGNEPGGSPYVQELNDAIGSFDLGGLQVDTTGLPNRVILHGLAVTSPLPASSQSRLCYRLKLQVESVSGFWNQFCIGPMDSSLQVSWTFDDGSPYAPTFRGVEVPGAQPFCIDLYNLPGMPPEFTSVPPTSVFWSHCVPYLFTVQAIDANTPPLQGPIRYYCEGASIDEYSGVLQAATTGADSTRVTISAIDCGGDGRQYLFTIHWSDVAPTFTNCPIMSAYVDTDDVYEYPFSVYDPDACDKVTYSVSNFGGGPHGAFAIDSTGKFVFTPTVDDYLYFYVFDLLASSGCGAIDSCQFRVGVGWSHCGDANGDWTVDISDVVHLITFIFNGGLPPNPPSEGDVDCSGGVDISDVVYIVTHIFSDGPGPCDGCK